MKVKLLFRIVVALFCFASTITYAQLHSQPSCGENFNLIWSSTPSASDEYNWVDGTLSNSYTNVDGSGVNINIAFTGETGALGVWDGQQTPKIGNSSSTLYTGLDLYNSGYSASGMVCTITFSSPIYALSFDMHHVNQSGQSGDKYTITGTNVDGDTIYPVFTDSSTPSYVSNNTNGIINANSPSVLGDDAVVGVNFTDDNYITSVSFLWQDCDTCSNYYIHGSGLGNFSFCIPQTLDFDGVNDYINRSAFLGNKTEATMMTWIKLDSSFDGGEIMGQRNFRLYIDSNNDLKSFVRTNTGVDVTSPNLAMAKLSTELWYHVALKYNGNSGLVELYLNGDNIWYYTNNNLIGTTLNNLATWNSDYDFEIGRNTYYKNDYYEGSIYETRIFNKALTTIQIQEQVYQEIENNSGNIRGTVIPKDIEGLAWSDLELYYKMDIINTGKTPDESISSIYGNLNNMRTYQDRTAPLPYQTKSGGNGDWADSNNWLYGSVWDISNNHTDCAIVKIQDDISTSISHKTIGLIIDGHKKLIVNGDNLISNSWYLELNGTLDLKNDSQLIQQEYSDLVTSSTGKILRRQEGNTSVYWYNYWSSPVGVTASTTLSDNNASTNNANNTDFTLNTLKEGDESSVQFTSAYNEVGKISTRWLYTYKNGLNYYQWASLAPSSVIEPGVGYTQKGIGNPGTEQQYIFEGKPNNGTILIAANDLGGAGSVPSVSKTDYLLGNPYPSALDIHQFIDDNAGVIDGTLQLWQQWSGTSHNLNEYDGGYASVNKLGSIRAYQFVGMEGATNGNQDGTVTPSKYLPVGQGFITEIVNSGNIEFNNKQRVFIKESDADGSYDNGSSFFRLTEENQDDTVVDSDDVMQKIRIEFNAVTGPDTRRELLLGFSGITSDAYDYGYDAKNTDALIDDLNLILDDQKMLMQAYASITNDKIVPLVINTSGDFTYEIKITELEHIDDDQEIYLKDNLTGTYFNLRSDTNQAYSFSSEAGEFNSRFEIVFQSEESLSTPETDYVFNLIYYNNTSKKLFAKNLNTSVDRLMLINMLGQTVQEFNGVAAHVLDNGMDISNLSSGTYIAYFKMESVTKTKKIIIE